MEEVLPLPRSISLNIDEIRKGAPSAEDFVTDPYVKLRPSLISYVYHLIGSTRDAEDLVQVVFIHKQSFGFYDQHAGNANADARLDAGFWHRSGQ